MPFNLIVKTAETHRSKIMRKLGLHSVSELVLYAVRNQIVQVNVGVAFLSAGTANATEIGSTTVPKN